jgi:succinate dehydrogenase hydrophobic anchor subunit
MQEIKDYLPMNFAPMNFALLSVITIYMTVLAGNKNRHAWAIGLFNQALWLAWILLTKNYGFLPMNFALWIVYWRNHIKWGKT